METRITVHTNMVAHNEVLVLECPGAAGAIVVVVVIERLTEEILQRKSAQVEIDHRSFDRILTKQCK